MPRQALAVLFKYVYEWHRFLNSPPWMTSGQIVRWMCNRRPRYFFVFLSSWQQYTWDFPFTAFEKPAPEWERRKYIICGTKAGTEDELKALNIKRPYIGAQPCPPPKWEVFPTVYSLWFTFISRRLSQNSHLRINHHERKRYVTKKHTHKKIIITGRRTQVLKIWGKETWETLMSPRHYLCWESYTWEITTWTQTWEKQAGEG